jgi:hypothetical protein
LDITSKAQARKAKPNKCDCINLKSFCIAKNEEEIYNIEGNTQNCTSNKGLTSRIYKELK